VYPVILSCLADVAANDRSHPFFHEWVSSRSSQNCAAHLLLDIWRAEEKARVMVDQQGAVAAPERPLDGTAQRVREPAAVRRRLVRLLRACSTSAHAERLWHAS
jgi:hypothetical protein